jgi:phenylpyruvate tautomerase PptA (4-oxalocrotonate tautomerase family)
VIDVSIVIDVFHLDRETVIIEEVESSGWMRGGIPREGWRVILEACPRELSIFFR